MGSPSGIAATASDTVLQHWKISIAMSSRKVDIRTSNSKHVQPRSTLQNTNQTDNAYHTERKNGQFLRKFVHTKLERRSLFFNLKKDGVSIS